MTRKVKPSSIVRISQTTVARRRPVCAERTASAMVKLLPMRTTVLMAAEREVQLVAAFGPRLRIPDAVEHVGQEQAAEEHDFGDEEQPHAERGGFVLLPQRIEVVLQVRMVMGVRAVIAMGGERPQTTLTSRRAYS